MNHFQTGRHFFNFYLILALMLLLLYGIGLRMILDFYGAWGTSDFKVAHYLLLFMGCWMLLFGAFLLIMYIRNVPIIVLERDRILFGNETYFLDDVAILQLTGKYPFGWGISFPAEGACLTFKDGRKKFIFDTMYTDGSRLKVLLERQIHQTAPTIECKIQNLRNLQFMDNELFKGNSLINFRAVMLWLIIGFFLLVLLFSPSPIHRDGLIFLAGFGIMWFLGISWGMHYFGLTSEYFIIRNHFFFGKSMFIN